MLSRCRGRAVEASWECVVEKREVEGHFKGPLGLGGRARAGEGLQGVGGCRQVVLISSVK